jgi:hypothetical protein
MNATRMVNGKQFQFYFLALLETCTEQLLCRRPVKPVLPG